MWIVCITMYYNLSANSQKIFTSIIRVGKPEECLHSETGNVKVLGNEIKPKPAVSQKKNGYFLA